MWSPQPTLLGKPRNDASLVSLRDRVLFALLVFLALLSAIVLGLSAYIRHALGVAASLISLLVACAAAVSLAGTPPRRLGALRARRALIVVALLLGAFVLLLAVVRFGTPNVFVVQFPNACPAKSRNCVRVAPHNSYRANGTEPLRFASPPVTCGGVYNATSAFCDAESARIVYSSDKDGVFVHAIFSTTVIGFVDDLYVLCQHSNASASQLIVSVQSASRIGEYDFGANLARVRAYNAAISNQIYVDDDDDNKETSL